MREQRTEGPGAVEDVSTEPAIDAGQEGKTQFRAEGTIPPVGSAEPAAPAQASASDQAFGDVSGGGGRAAVGAGAGGGGGGGQPLPDDLRIKFEASLGADLSGVRVHVDGNADKKTKAAGAKATATGQDIHLAPGEYDPHSAKGQELLAHEVAHTVQQKHAAPQTQAKSELPAPSSGPEREADGAASAMVSGEKATVSPVAEQKPHAKDDERDKLVAAYRSSLNAGNWTDVALRLNGFSDDDIAMFVGKMSGGQHAHVREGAEAAMPGWSQRVTNAIDAADGNAARISTLYAAYEKAVVTAKSSGNWSEVVERLNGMGDPDIQDRLKKLTWFDYEAIRAQTTNARVLAAVDKADTARVQRSYTAYEQAIAAHDYLGAAKQLHGFSDEDLTAHMVALGNHAVVTKKKDGEKGDPKPDGAQQLQFLRAAALKLHDDRVLAAIDAAIVDHPPDATTVTPIDYTASVALPDVSDDARLLAGLNLDDFGGNAKVADFCQQLAQHFGAESAAKSKKPDNAEVATTTELAKLRASFKSTGEFVRAGGGGMSYTTFAGFAKDWMSEMREGVDAKFMLSNWHSLKPNPFDPDEKGLEPLHGTTSGHQLVDPWVNKFVDALPGCAAGTYHDHGGKSWGPFCVDLNPQIARDERGLYQKEPLLEFYRQINSAAAGADWSSLYNDATLAKAVNADLGVNRVSYAGDDGTGNWHGALKLHLHIYLKPPTAAVVPDPKSGPDHQEGG